MMKKDSKSPAASPDSRKRQRSNDKASEDVDLGAPIENVKYKSSEDSKRTYAEMYVPKEVTESSSGKDSDNTIPRDNIEEINKMLRKPQQEVIPQHRSLKGMVWLVDITRKQKHTLY